MAKTAFVTGGTGFLGLNLIEQLVEAGWRVIALHRVGSNLKYLTPLRVEPAVGDICDAASVMAAMPESVDAVFHVAGDVSLWSRGNAQQDRVNIDGTRNVAEAALAKQARRFIHTSSIAAYGLFDGCIDETAPQLGAKSWINYQRSKYAAEEVVRAALSRGLDVVIMNPTGIMGHGDVSAWGRIIRLICSEKLPGMPPGSGSFCHAGEVAKAHIAAVERGRRGENYLLGGTDSSYLALAAIIGEVTGHTVPSRPTPAFVLRIVGKLGEWGSIFTGKAPTLTPESAAMVTRDRKCDSSKAMRELGYRAVDLRSMVKESYDWLKQEDVLAI